MSLPPSEEFPSEPLGKPDDRDVSHTLHGPELSWLHLIVDGALPRVFGSAESSSGDAGIAAPALRMPGHHLSTGDGVNLLDPEGVTLAHLAVRRVDGDLVSGDVEPRSGFTIVDHVEYRAAADNVRAIWKDGPVWALWVESPVTYAVRASVREAARSAGASVAEIVPVPTGFETSRTANAPVRLAMNHTTRDEGDRMVIVPWPDAPWDGDGVKLRAQLAAAYGATELFVTDNYSPDHSAIPVRTVDVPRDRRAVPTEVLDAFVLDGERLPDWAAEPEVAAVIQQLHRPSSRDGLTVLLSGLSGSGKSTVARALSVRLVEHESRSVSLLDGDVVRHHLSKGLGFSRPDRITNVLRIGFVASEITKAGGIAICCPIAPYDETRRAVRTMVNEHGAFVLVHVATPLAECERRDRKGLYAKARRGEIPEFTGISDPYETPTDADVVIDTTGRTIEECVETVYRHLVDHGLVAQ